MSPSPLRLVRFERRILFVMAAVAFVPLAAALFFARGALEEAYRVGVNGRVGRELESCLALYGDYRTHLRADAEGVADAIASDGAVRTALEQEDRAGLREALRAELRRFPNVTAIEVERGTERLADVACGPCPEPDEAVPEHARAIVLLREVPGGTIRVTEVPGARLEAAHVRAGEVVASYRRLEAATGYVSGFFLAIYAALLLSVSVVALAIGIVVSRRVTRRIAALADAARKVGAGDLTVELPTDESDEVAELTRAFNAMVRDIHASRDRIEYLQRVGAWQEMARRLAHEIKNPLTPIQLAVQEVHGAYHGDDPKFRRTLEAARAIVEEEVAALRRLVQDFSDLARLPEPALADADLGAFAAEAAGAFDPAALASEGGAPAPGLVVPALRLEIEPGALPVRIDAMMLRRCLDNLARNAVQAIVQSRAKGGPGSVVLIAARADGPGALLEVRDDGPGVPRPLRERVFEPYYTTREEGTGLGLAIVKKVVLEHGGTIECGQAPEGGAAFRIRLPLRRSSVG